MPRYYSNACRRPRVAPGDLPIAIGVMVSPDARQAIGIAYPASHVGGWRGLEYLGPSEATWRLVIGKEELEGRFAPRAGEFVELAEDSS